jgi:hypothetical protein
MQAPRFPRGVLALTLVLGLAAPGPVAAQAEPFDRVEEHWRQHRAEVNRRERRARDPGWQVVEDRGVVPGFDVGDEGDFDPLRDSVPYGNGGTVLTPGGTCHGMACLEDAMNTYYVNGEPAPPEVLARVPELDELMRIGHEIDATGLRDILARGGGRATELAQMASVKLFPTQRPLLRDRDRYLLTTEDLHRELEEHGSAVLAFGTRYVRRYSWRAPFGRNQNGGHAVVVWGDPRDVTLRNEQGQEFDAYLYRVRDPNQPEQEDSGFRMARLPDGRTTFLGRDEGIESLMKDAYQGAPFHHGQIYLQPRRVWEQASDHIDEDLFDSSAVTRQADVTWVSQDEPGPGVVKSFVKGLMGQ